MARVKVSGIATNKASDDKLIVIPEGTINVYQGGTSTPVDLYATEGAGSPSSIETDTDGSFEFWIDVLYANRRLKIEISKSGYSTQVIDDYQVFLDINDLNELTDPDDANDYVWVEDFSDLKNPKKLKLGNIGGYQKIDLFAGGHDLGTPVGNWATHGLADASSYWFPTFYLPIGTNSIEEAVLVFWPASNNASADIDIYSAWAANGEDRTSYSDSDTSSTYNISANDLFELDLTGILSGVEGGDYVGIKVTNNTGAYMYILGIRIKLK